MTPENAKKVWSLILEAGDYLKDKLPESPNHPKGRNPYAHIALEIKNKFESTYKEIPDDKINEVIKYIEYLKNNPS
tara:strand:- start:754 stop:981 length:228 start_codon:yes stop_codon:yes gene_type:complete